MNAQLLDGTEAIVAKFADWVKSLCAEFAMVDTPARAMELEQRIRAKASPSRRASTTLGQQPGSDGTGGDLLELP
jgi:hypothetical protein